MQADSTNQVQSQEKQTTDKELNFRALEQKHQRQLETERQARLEAEKKIQELTSKSNIQEEEEDDSEPYIDKNRLKKTMNRFDQQTKTSIQQSMEMAKQAAKEELKQELWLENHEDFSEVLSHAEKLAQAAPGLANSILKMPDGFERQKLVYENIKAMGLNKERPKEPSVQDKIDANRKSPYYQPSGIANSPHVTGGDFSKAGQKQAYDKMQELKSRLRIN